MIFIYLIYFKNLFIFYYLFIARSVGAYKVRTHLPSKTTYVVCNKCKGV